MIKVAGEHPSWLGVASQNLEKFTPADTLKMHLQKFFALRLQNY